MKKFITFICVLFLALALVACGGNKEENKDNENGDPSGNGKTLNVALEDSYKGLCDGATVYLTTVGQSDLQIVHSIISKASKELKFEENEKLTADQCVQKEVDTKKPVVFLVTGTSNKGLGAAGVKLDDEKNRAKAFANAAAAGTIELVVFHVGMKERRGDQTDPVLDLVCAKANLMLVVEGTGTDGGDYDGYFTNVAKNNNVSLHLYEKATNIVDAVKVLYNVQ